MSKDNFFPTVSNCSYAGISWYEAPWRWK